MRRAIRLFRMPDDNLHVLDIRRGDLLIVNRSRKSEPNYPMLIEIDGIDTVRILAEFEGKLLLATGDDMNPLREITGNDKRIRLLGIVTYMIPVLDD